MTTLVTPATQTGTTPYPCNAERQHSFVSIRFRLVCADRDQSGNHAQPHEQGVFNLGIAAKHRHPPILALASFQLGFLRGAYCMREGVRKKSTIFFSGFRSRVWGLGFSGFGFRVQGFGFRVQVFFSGFGFSGFGFRVFRFRFRLHLGLLGTVEHVVRAERHLSFDHQVVKWTSLRGLFSRRAAVE